MRPRTEIIEMFSTFVELEQNRFSRWLADTKLHRSMQKCLDSWPEVSTQENFWALYWHQHWQNEQSERDSTSKSNSLAKMHIQAYLQEPCYYVAQKIFVLLRNNQYGIADYFQMANAEVETILGDFNPRRSSGLKPYFTMALRSRLRDILRRRKEADICTEWALLRKVSKKLFVEALDNVGLSTLQIAQYRLAWTCFKQLYIQNQPGGTKALPQPTPQLWQAIANLYNDSRLQLDRSTSECTVQNIQEWLNQSVIYIRAYFFPTVTSLNSFNPNDDDASLKVDLADPSSDSIIADMIAAEDLQNRQQQIDRMFGVLSQALKGLDPTSQQILRLYYQDELTQQQIMQHLEISQSTISRKLVKGREFLLKALVNWSQELNISVNPNQIKNMSIALEEWLRNQFGDFDVNP